MMRKRKANILRIVISVICMITAIVQISTMLKRNIILFAFGILLLSIALILFCYIRYKYLNYIVAAPLLLLVISNIINLIGKDIISILISLIEIIMFVIIAGYITRLLNNNVAMVIACAVIICLLLFNMKAVFDSIDALMAVQYNYTWGTKDNILRLRKLLIPTLIVPFTYVVPFFSMLALTISGDM